MLTAASASAHRVPSTLIADYGREKKLLCETFFILRRTDRDVIKNVYRSASCKVAVIVGRFLTFRRRNFLLNFSTPCI